MEHSPSWEANRFSASQEISRIYGNQRFITALTRARHLSLSWATSIQSMPHPTAWRSILLSSSHKRLRSGLFPSGPPNQNPLLYSPVTHSCYTPSQSHSWFTIRVTFSEQYRSLSSSLCSFLHSPVASSLLAQIFPSAPYSENPFAYVAPTMSATKFYIHTK